MQMLGEENKKMNRKIKEKKLERWVTRGKRMLGRKK